MKYLHKKFQITLHGQKLQQSKFSMRLINEININKLYGYGVYQNL